MRITFMSGLCMNNRENTDLPGELGAPYFDRHLYALW